MSDVLVIYKNRTNIVPVQIKDLDVSDDTITAQIREHKDIDSELLATWSVEFIEFNEDDPEATYSSLVMTIDDSMLTEIEVRHGYMDFKRLSAGEPLPLIIAPQRVHFQDSVTE